MDFTAGLGSSSMFSGVATVVVAGSWPSSDLLVEEAKTPMELRVVTGLSVLTRDLVQEARRIDVVH